MLQVSPRLPSSICERKLERTPASLLCRLRRPLLLPPVRGRRGPQAHRGAASVPVSRSRPLAAR